MNKQHVEAMILHQQQEGISNARIAHTLQQGAWAGYISPEVAEYECRKLGYPMKRKSHSLAHSHRAHSYLNATIQKATLLEESYPYEAN